GQSKTIRLGGRVSHWETPRDRESLATLSKIQVVPGRPAPSSNSALRNASAEENLILAHPCRPRMLCLTVTRRFLAFDLGAESGRAILGEQSPGGLGLTEVCRFPNQPVRGDGALQWDVLRLWSEMRGAFDQLDGTSIDGVGVDTWGCDFALIGE